MKTPNKPGMQPKKNGSGKEGLLNAFAKEIVHGNVVLLLGHESLIRIPSAEECADDEDLQLLRDSNGSMETWMETLKSIFFNPSEPVSLKNFFTEMFDGDNGEECPIPRLEVSDLNPEILRLIKSKAFRLVLTTTFDPLIEEAMEDAWGGKGEIDIKNFGDRFNKDFSGLDRVVLADDIKPTLYYLFGKATKHVSDYGNPKFIVDEEDYIQTIRDWMVAPPKSLISYLSGKRILAIGCKFDNWLFRFFWRNVLETKRNTDDFKHLIAISLTSSESDQKLKEIFKLYNLKFPNDVNEFLHSLNDAIEIQKVKALEEERSQGGIFLSYCSKDFPKVLNLFYKLKDCGFNVWMDNSELKYGDEYKSRISSAINNSTVFVPILSKEISRHLPAKDRYDEKDENYHFYRDFEWNNAQLKYKNDRNNYDPSPCPLQIVPFALDDYNPRANAIPHQIKEDYPFIFEKTLDSYNNAGFVRFIKTLKEYIP